MIVAAHARALGRETGLIQRSSKDSGSVSGVYRRSVVLASGRYAMLDYGFGFSLVPWQPVIEKRLGQSMTAVIRGDQITWQFGRQRSR
jgi:hypothetical protein